MSKYTFNFDKTAELLALADKLREHDEQTSKDLEEFGKHTAGIYVKRKDVGLYEISFPSSFNGWDDVSVAKEAKRKLTNLTEGRFALREKLLKENGVTINE